MNKDNRTQQEIEATLNSLDNISRAEAPPYFYTRLIAKMEQNKVSVASRILQLFSKPAISISVLVVFLVLNLMAIKGIMASPKTLQANTTAAQNFAAEYNLNTTSVYAN